MVSPRYLLDSNVVSEPTHPQPDEIVLERIRAHRDELAIGAPVWLELLFGYHRLPQSRRRQEIERYLEDVVRATMPILPYDAAAEWHAAERARLVSAGRTPSFIDGQIAAIAVTNGLTLVTANVADYRAFADLVIEDWRS